MLSATISRGLAIVATIAVAISGLLPAPHAHVDLIHSIVHTHGEANVVAPHHDADDHHDADHQDAAFDHGDHAAAVTLLPSSDVAIRYVLSTSTIEKAIAITVATAASICELPGGTLLPTHDPPLRFTSSPAPPAVV